MPPGERLKDVPGAVSAIILKLLAKTPEERYQTAGGVERDLRRCLAEGELRGCIVDFPLGEHDTPDRLLIPEKLYGRAREVETLLAAFDRVVQRTQALRSIRLSGSTLEISHSPRKWHQLAELRECLRRCSTQEYAKLTQAPSDAATSLTSKNK